MELPYDWGDKSLTRYLSSPKETCVRDELHLNRVIGQKALEKAQTSQESYCKATDCPLQTDGKACGLFVNSVKINCCDWFNEKPNSQELVRYR